MFFAHLPAGYLVAKGMLALPWGKQLNTGERRALMTTGLIASVLPDIDLFYFYLWSDRSVGHHAYITHTPAAWFLLAVLVALAGIAFRKDSWQWHNLFLLMGVQLHFVLDTVAGQIRWFFPFYSTWHNWMHVPRQPGWWVWSFMSHPSMAIEAFIIAVAAWVAWRANRRPLWRPAFIVAQ